MKNHLPTCLVRSWSPPDKCLNYWTWSTGPVQFSSPGNTEKSDPWLDWETWTHGVQISGNIYWTTGLVIPESYWTKNMLTRPESKTEEKYRHTQTKLCKPNLNKISSLWATFFNAVESLDEAT